MPLFQKQRPLTEGNDLEVTASFEMDVQIRSMKESPLFLLLQRREQSHDSLQLQH